MTVATHLTRTARWRWRRPPSRSAGQLSGECRHFLPRPPEVEEEIELVDAVPHGGSAALNVPLAAPRDVKVRLVTEPEGVADPVSGLPRAPDSCRSASFRAPVPKRCWKMQLTRLPVASSASCSSTQLPERQGGRLLQHHVHAQRHGLQGQGCVRRRRRADGDQVQSRFRCGGQGGGGLGDTHLFRKFCCPARVDIHRHDELRARQLQGFRMGMGNAARADDPHAGTMLGLCHGAPRH